MRKLGANELYLLSEIADKMDLELPDLPKETNEEQMKNWGMKLFTKMFRKVYKAKNEMNKLIENLTGKKIDEMSIKEIKDNITEILKQEGVMDFFISTGN